MSQTQPNPLSKIDEAPIPARTKTDFENTRVGVQISTVDEALTLAKAFAASKLFKDVADASQCVAKIMMGAEFGISPVASMSGIHIVQGKMQMSGVMIGTLIKRHPRYDYRVRETTNEACTIEFFEDGQSLGSERFTKEDAQRQGTQNMQKFPRNMLWNRAMSNGAKFYCPDVFGGMPIYTEGEIEDVAPAAPAPRPPATRADQIKDRMAAALPTAAPELPAPDRPISDNAAEAKAWADGLPDDDGGWFGGWWDGTDAKASQLFDAREAGCTTRGEVMGLIENGVIPGDGGLPL